MTEPVKAPTKPDQKPSLVVPDTEQSKEEAKKITSFITWMIVIIVLTVLIGGYIIYRLSKQYVYQSNLNKSVDKTNQLLETKKLNLEALKPNLEAVKSKSGSQKSDAEQILLALPTNSDYENLIAMLERMARESNVKIESLDRDSGGSSSVSDQPGSTTNSASPQEFSFNISLKGSYNAILDFIAKSEDSARVINFSSMELSGEGTDLTASLIFVTYFQDEANIESKQESLQ